MLQKIFHFLFSMNLNSEKLKSDIKAAISMYTAKPAEAMPGYDEKLISRIIARVENLVFHFGTGLITKETVDFLMEGIEKAESDLIDAVCADNVFAHGKAMFAVGFVVRKTLSDLTGMNLVKQSG